MTSPKYFFSDLDSLCLNGGSHWCVLKCAHQMMQLMAPGPEGFPVPGKIGYLTSPSAVWKQEWEEGSKGRLQPLWGCSGGVSLPGGLCPVLPVSARSDLILCTFFPGRRFLGTTFSGYPQRLAITVSHPCPGSFQEERVKGTPLSLLEPEPHSCPPASPQR